MHLENVVRDARDPELLGRFWAAALGADPFDGACSRLHLGGGAWLDLCFQPVPDAPTDDPRLHLDLLGGHRQAAVVEELLALGATHADIGQGDVPWVVLADPEGTPFCVMDERPEYTATGPLAALPLDSADPDRDAAFWAALTGWVPVEGTPGTRALRHPAGVGPLLELCPETSPHTAKNRLHLDVRKDTADDEPPQGARRIHDPYDLPWVVYADPSGNEFCVLEPSGD
ncbi:VOC family protein [Actinomycetospora atypica]|uniref:VOC family protein n=1 Tax=Actinomycetospora atypica TaxID=1290095 RepID=A0ABV9YW74_9PSEU